MLRPLNIGLSIRTFDPQSGGLQVHAQRLATELRGRGHQVRVITRTVSRPQSYQDYFRFGEPPAQTQVDGIPTTILSRSRALNPLMWAISKCVCRPALRHLGVQLYGSLLHSQAVNALRGVDLVHHIGQGSEMIGFAAEGAARRLGVPFLVQSCIHPYQWGDSPLDWQLYRRATGLLTNTDFERDYFVERLPPSVPVQTVYCGVDAPTLGGGDAFRARHQITGPIVLFLGRRDVDKGYPALIEAFHLVAQGAQGLPQATLVCAGTSLEKVTPWTGQRRVVELGWISAEEKQQALSACDVLCVPSVGESFGMAFIEAGLHGKPVIGRNIPVLRELLGERDCGILVGRASATGNDVSLEPSELAHAILELLLHPEQARRLGECGRERSQRFRWCNLIQRYESAYRLFGAGGSRSDVV